MKIKHVFKVHFIRSRTFRFSDFVTKYIFEHLDNFCLSIFYIFLKTNLFTGQKYLHFI